LQRNEVIVRQQPDHYINQSMQPHRGTSVQSYRDDRPSQVVSGSSQRHSLQDMLVPSIESNPCDVTRPLIRTEERHATHETFDHRQGSYPRQVIESRRLSPPRQQFIVIDDDSPQNKRRRVFHEDDSGRFRPFPSRDYSTTLSADSHLLSSSSVQPRYSPPRLPVTQNRPSPVMSGPTNSSYITATGKSIPIYDAPDHGYIGRPPEHFRRTEVYDPAQPNGGTVVRQLTSTRPINNHASELPHHRPTHEGRMENVYSARIGENAHRSRQVDLDYRVPPHGSRSPSFPVSSRVSRSYDVGSGRDVMDQAFIHNFSQSRINGSVHPGDRFSAMPESSRPGLATDAQDLRRGYEEQRTRPYSTVPVPARARSPAGYIERPM
jgi:hypothetical protein